MTAIPMELSAKLSDVTGSGKSKMAASKLPKYIAACTQGINEIPTAIPMFSGPNYPIKIVAMLYDQTEETGSGKSKMAASKFPKCTSQLVHLATKFRRIYPCFRGPTIK